MSENPYQPPADVVSPIVVWQRYHWRKLRRIAVYQKGVLCCLLLYGAAIVGSLLLPERTLLFLSPLVIADVVIAAIFVFLLSIEVYGLWLGLAVGLITMTPCLGLFVLVLTNGKASAAFRRHKLSVGLFGVNLSEISAARLADTCE